jgi:hypothetical protein
MHVSETMYKLSRQPKILESSTLDAGTVYSKLELHIITSIFYYSFQLIMAYVHEHCNCNIYSETGHV